MTRDMDDDQIEDIYPIIGPFLYVLGQYPDSVKNEKKYVKVGSFFIPLHLMGRQSLRGRAVHLMALWGTGFLAFGLAGAIISNKIDTLSDIIFCITLLGMCSLATSYLSEPGSTQAQKIEKVMLGIHHLLLRTPMSTELRQAKSVSRWTALISVYASVMVSVAVFSMPSIRGLFTSVRSLFPRLPIPVWPPPCPPNSDWCESFLMTFEVWMVFILCTAYGCFTTIHICSLVYLTELLRVPAIKLRSTLQSASNQRSFSGAKNKRSDKCWVNTDREVNLIIFYQHKVIGLIDQYNDCFAELMFIRQSLSVLFLVGSALLFMKDPTNFQAVSIAIFTFCTLFTFVYWGDKLNLANDEMLWAVYDCGWENLPVQLRTKLCLILCRGNRPIGVRTKYVGFLTYPSFLQLVRSSYNVLQFLFQL